MNPTDHSMPNRWDRSARAGALLLAFFLLYGCYEHRSHVCATGTICPPDKACTEKGNKCIAATDLCGNGIVDANESCDDGTATDTIVCNASCTKAVCGDGYHNPLAGEQCDPGKDPTECNADCTLSACGDGKLNPRFLVNAALGLTEQCDNGALNSDETNTECTTSCQKPKCGDGIVESQLGEQCDLGKENSNDPGTQCTVLCETPRCGDGITEYGEECDDGDKDVDEHDDCTNNCKKATCGDGILWNKGSGTEQCDLGDANGKSGPKGQPMVCTLDCRLPNCGDGIVQLGEECDRGQDNSDEAMTLCTRGCKAPACGDGILEQGEPCDDGNHNEHDRCTSECKEARCGDGIVWNLEGGAEQCDLGDGVNGVKGLNGITCTAGCKFPVCGNGIVELGEPCDDGNDDSEDDCIKVDERTCEAAICGDGIRQTKGSRREDCDEGHESASCDSDCSNPECGDKHVNPISSEERDGEQCDDGAESSSCNDNCTFAKCGDGVVNKEAGEECDYKDPKGPPCTPACKYALCGDNFVQRDGEKPEECDVGRDAYGNVRDTANCDSDCSDAKCGDGYLNRNAGEECDDGNGNPCDGCNELCKVEEGWVCGGNRPSQCRDNCGDGVLMKSLREACDDHNTVDGDGCSSKCLIEFGYYCPESEVVCASACEATRLSGRQHYCAAAALCHSVCGDGLLASDEKCDDGNTNPNDGCTADCKAFEAGWDCTPGRPWRCSPVCGDGLIRGIGANREPCDDHNLTQGDGCNDRCIVEDGWTCSGEPSTCSPVCGDGLIRGSEANPGRCDDGATGSGNGCSADCNVEPGWTCSGQPSTCSPVCGDGLIRGSEANPGRCDDGATVSGDGCSANCTVEPGWTCSGEPSTCSAVCGDGLIRGSEANPGRCDDRNSVSGDGCSADCNVESGWACSGEPSTCARSRAQG